MGRGRPLKYKKPGDAKDSDKRVCDVCGVVINTRSMATHKRRYHPAENVVELQSSLLTPVNHKRKKTLGVRLSPTPLARIMQLSQRIETSQRPPSSTSTSSSFCPSTPAIRTVVDKQQQQEAANPPQELFEQEILEEENEVNQKDNEISTQTSENYEIEEYEEDEKCNQFAQTISPKKVGKNKFNKKKDKIILPRVPQLKFNPLIIVKGSIHKKRPNETITSTKTASDQVDDDVFIIQDTPPSITETTTSTKPVSDELDDDDDDDVDIIEATPP